MATEREQQEQLQRMTRRPSTPGEVVETLLEELKMTQGELADRLGVGRQTVNELLRGRRRLTPDMAHRLGRLFGNGAAIWLRMQTTVDLWDALHMDTAPYERIEPVKLVA